MNSNNLVLNRLFTQHVFKDLTNNNDNNVYGTIIRRYLNNNEKDNQTIISEIYQVLSKEYRNEYFYINTLLNKLLLGKHSVNTSTALTQIPIGKSKADFILINGKATVYEIKTELDTFDRLDTQIADYYKAFDTVCVVTSENNYCKLEKLLNNSSVGIYSLTKRDTISKSLLKEPKENKTLLDHNVIFKVLNKKEHESILNSYYGKLPNTTQAFYFRECSSWFSKIPINQAYLMFLEQLKLRSTIIMEDFKEIPYELKSLFYFSNKNILKHKKLIDFLNKKYGG